MEDGAVCDVPVLETAVESTLSSDSSAFPEGYKNDTSHSNTYEPIYQDSPDSTVLTGKVSDFSEFSPAAFAVLNDSPIVTQGNPDQLDISQQIPDQSQLLFLASDTIINSSDFGNVSTAVPSVINPTSSIFGGTEVAMPDKIFQSHETLCRICANETAKPLPLFHSDGISLDLVEKIHRCLPIKVSEDDDLPQHICEDCAMKLQTCDGLISLSIAGNAKLKTMAWMWTKLESQPKVGDEGKRGANEGKGPLTMIMMKEVTPQTLKPEYINHSQHTEGEQQTLELCSNESQQTEVDKDLLGLELTDDGEKEESEVQGLDQSFPGDGRKSFDTSVTSKPEKCMILVARTWSCSECDYKATRQSSLTQHKRHKHSTDTNKREPSTEEQENEANLKLQMTCEYCGKSFRSKANWKRHQNFHTMGFQQKEVPETLQTCSLCNEDFTNVKRLQFHLKRVHNVREEVKHSCDKCGKSYRLASSLNIHRATHSNEAPYLCDICGKSFKHGSNLRCHRRSHAEDKLTHPHACDICPKSFRSRFHLSEHKNVHLNITPYACDVCGKKFHRRIQLRQHRTIHDSESSHECSQCGACFNRRGNMTQHMKTHLKERKFICKVCKGSFQTLSEVVQHRRQHTHEELVSHLKEKGGYSCSKCLKLFSSSSDLENHSKSHAEMKFECEICNKQLSNRRTLEYHVRSFHTMDRPYSCQHCSETFLSKEVCTVHERRHTGEKPYICSHCKMSFRCSSNLAQHMSTHRDERPWACEHCPKSFKRKGILMVHMRTHTGEKPFCCEICGRRFTQKNDMLKHQQTHTSAKQAFVCVECSWPFHTRKELNKHCKVHHNTGTQSTLNIAPPLPSHPQTLLITNDLCQFPITILGEGSNVIVHQIEELGKHPQIVELNSADSNSQILHFTESLLQTVLPESQIISVQESSNQQVMNFTGEAVGNGLQTSAEENWLSPPK